MRRSTSVSQASGSTLLSLQVWIRVFAMAQRRAPASLPANNEFFLVMVTGLMARSTTLVCVPWQGALLSPVKVRAGKLSLQPEALGAGQEATNGLKHFEKKTPKGGQRTVRAAT